MTSRPAAIGLVLGCFALWGCLANGLDEPAGGDEIDLGDLARADAAGGEGWCADGILAGITSGGSPPLTDTGAQMCARGGGVSVACGDALIELPLYGFAVYRALGVVEYRAGDDWVYVLVIVPDPEMVSEALRPIVVVGDSFSLTAVDWELPSCEAHVEQPGDRCVQFPISCPEGTFPADMLSYCQVAMSWFPDDLNETVGVCVPTDQLVQVDGYVQGSSVGSVLVSCDGEVRTLPRDEWLTGRQMYTNRAFFKEPDGGERPWGALVSFRTLNEAEAVADFGTFGFCRAAEGTDAE